MKFKILLTSWLLCLVILLASCSGFDTGVDKNVSSLAETSSVAESSPASSAEVSSDISSIAPSSKAASKAASSKTASKAPAQKVNPVEIENIKIPDLASSDAFSPLPEYVHNTKYSYIKESDYYGYSTLNTNRKKYYTAIRDTIKNMGEGCILPGASETDTHIAYFAVMCDYPQYFWMGHQYLYGRNESDMIVLFSYKDDDYDVDYICTRAEAISRIKAMNSEITRIFNAMPSGLSEFDRQKYLHDYLANKNSYDERAVSSWKSYLDAFNAYGALIKGRIVCEGYSRGWQLLLREAGIQASVVAGTGAEEAHMWNVMKIEGSWYYSDLTWNDGNPNPYEYFNIPRYILEFDHTLSTTNAASNPENFNLVLPECNSVAQNYLFVNGFGFDKSNYDNYEALLFAKIQEAALAGKREIRFIVSNDIDETLYINVIAYIGSRLNYSALNAPLGSKYIGTVNMGIYEREYYYRFNW